jgi:hypothetical protein
MRHNGKLWVKQAIVINMEMKTPRLKMEGRFLSLLCWIMIFILFQNNIPLTFTIIKICILLKEINH